MSGETIGGEATTGTVQVTGHQGDEIPAYLAHPPGPGPFAGVVVLHHMPGYDEATKEITRTFAANGYTAIMPNLHWRDAPGASPDDASAAARAAGCYVDVGFWGGAVPTNVGRLSELLDAGALGVKCFLVDSGIPEFPPLDDLEVASVLREIAAVDGVLLAHAEDPAVLAAAPQPRGRSYQDFLASRPAEAEDQAIARLVTLAAVTGARVHVVHLSSASALPLLADARRDGVRITAETCPHYLSLAAEDIPDGATQYKCCPPIRDAANRDGLWKGLADGLIDLVVSDHCPCPAALKSLASGDFETAWGGISSLQLGLPVVWTVAKDRGHGLADVAHWMAAAPAGLAGLPSKGRITVGADADLCVFAPAETWLIEPAALHHRHPLTPYTGRLVTGRVRATWLRGERISDSRPTGRLLSGTSDE